jgi:hypothetical protein
MNFSRRRPFNLVTSLSRPADLLVSGPDHQRHPRPPRTYPSAKIYLRLPHLLSHLLLLTSAESATRMLMARLPSAPPEVIKQYVTLGMLFDHTLTFAQYCPSCAWGLIPIIEAISIHSDTQLLCFLVNWGLYGVLCVQTCKQPHLKFRVFR